MLSISRSTDQVQGCFVTDKGLRGRTIALLQSTALSEMFDITTDIKAVAMSLHHIKGKTF